MHVFISVQWGVEIQVADVHCHVSGTWCGDNAVQVHFECFKAGCFGADVSRVIKNEVAATGVSGLILFVLLWSDSADNYK